MKFKCSQNNLTSGLNHIQKIISSKSTLPILSGILIETCDRGLKLTGNDLNTAVETTIEAQIDEPGSVVVSSRLFGDIIRKLPGEQISIEVDENNQMHILCERSEFYLMGEPSVEYPDLPEVKDDRSFFVPCDLFSNMIGQTIFAISQNDSKPVLMGSLFQIENQKLTIVSIDGYRLAIRTAHVDTDIEEKVVIPGKALSEIYRILGAYNDKHQAKISFTAKHVMVSVENVKIISRLLEGEFIQYEKVQPTSFKSELSINRTLFSNAIERASLMAREGKNHSIKLTIKDDLMCIQSNTEKGQVKEEVSLSLEGEDIEIGFNPKYLLDGLKAIDSEIIKMRLSSSISPCVIVPGDYDTYTYIVTPVRIAGTSYN